MILIEVSPDDFEADSGVRLQVEKDIEQAVAVLATRKTNHHTVAFTDHIEIGNRFADLPPQPFGELIGVVDFFELARSRHENWRGARSLADFHTVMLRPPSTAIT